ITWTIRAPAMPPITPHVATAQPSSSLTRSRISRSGSATPKKIPTAVKIPCRASVSGPMWTLGSSGIWIRRLASVTLLELLARTAPAGVVAPELGVRPRPRCGPAVASAAGGRPAARARLSAVLRVARRSLLGLLGLLRRAHRDAQDRLRDARRDARRHLLVEGVGFALVRDERILLPVPAQVDALAELLHLGEVLDPMRVDRP